jgi:hypothetical protein
MLGFAPLTAATLGDDGVVYELGASSDLTMTAEQTAYRQALRDITSHANWPYLDEADWPTKP